MRTVHGIGVYMYSIYMRDVVMTGVYAAWHAQDGCALIGCELGVEVHKT